MLFWTDLHLEFYRHELVMHYILQTVQIVWISNRNLDVSSPVSLFLFNIAAGPDPSFSKMSDKNTYNSVEQEWVSRLSYSTKFRECAQRGHNSFIFLFQSPRSCRLDHNALEYSVLTCSVFNHIVFAKL